MSRHHNNHHSFIGLLFRSFVPSPPSLPSIMAAVSLHRLLFFYLFSALLGAMLYSFEDQLRRRSSIDAEVVGKSMFALYDHRSMRQSLESLDYPALRFYLAYLLLDCGYAFFYGVALMDSVSILWPALPRRLWWLDLLPAVSAVCDVAENLLQMLVIARWPHATARIVVDLAMLCSLFKHLLFRATVMIVLAGLARWLLNHMSAKQRTRSPSSSALSNLTNGSSTATNASSSSLHSSGSSNNLLNNSSSSSSSSSAASSSTPFSVDGSSIATVVTADSMVVGGAGSDSELKKRH